MACLMPRKHQFDFWKCTPFILAACIINSPAWTQQAEKKSPEESKIEIVASPGCSSPEASSMWQWQSGGDYNSLAAWE
jgi:hypothetical protein